MTPMISRRPAIAALLTLALAAGCNDDLTAPRQEITTALRNMTVSQVDRFGLPAIATVFIPTAQKDAYNGAVPDGDQAAFRSFVVAKLTAFGHPNPNALADALLPDIQPVNLAQFTGFLAGGRRLADDVITAELGLIFGGNTSLNDDHVDANDKAFGTTFPYLASPWLP
jgi:hypothetical protein